MCKRITICGECEEILIEEPELYAVYKKIIERWAEGVQFHAPVFVDKSTSVCSYLEELGLIVSTETQQHYDRVQILPINCPHTR